MFYKRIDLLIKYTSPIFLCLVLFSCDCSYYVYGVILDEKTKKTIQNIAVGKTDNVDLENPFNKKSYTSEKGEFSISGISGSCKEVKMYFSSENYETKEVI